MMTAPASISPAGSRLVDPHRRWIHKLRVQLTDACNFRCFYCMPTDAKFMAARELLSADELVSIVEHLVDLGIDEVRITGGEPTVRKEFMEIVQRLSYLPIAKLGLTSNGYLLGRYLPELSATTLRHINISLDSLQPDKFLQITHSNTHEKIVSTIRQARNMGFTVKVNCVLFRGINDDEVADYVRFSAEEGIEVRFLEYMRIGSAYSENQNRFISAAEVITRLQAAGIELNSVTVPRDSTSFNFTTPEGARVGFIASESQPFCGNCSRLRLSATGILRACLMSTQGLNLRGVPQDELPQVVEKVMRMKPIGRIYEIKQDMHKIGG